MMVDDLTTARLRARPKDAGQGGSGEHGDAEEDRYAGVSSGQPDVPADGTETPAGETSRATAAARGRRTAAAGSAARVAGHQRARRRKSARQGRRADHDPTDHETVRQHLPDGPGVRGRQGRGQVQPGPRQGVPSGHRPARHPDGLSGREGHLRPDHERRTGRRRVDADEATTEAGGCRRGTRDRAAGRPWAPARISSSRPGQWTCRLPAPTRGGSRWCRGSRTTCRRSSLRHLSRSRRSRRTC